MASLNLDEDTAVLLIAMSAAAIDRRLAPARSTLVLSVTLTVTDIATGWTENRTVRNSAQAHVFAALTDVGEHLPFSFRGIDSDYADIGITLTTDRSSSTTSRSATAATNI